MTHPFEQYHLQPYLIEAIEEIGFNEPTEIQKKVIPEVVKGRDLIGQSQTGSGKTHAFLLPLFNQLDPKKQEVQLVITAPSRELAEQLYQAASQLAEHSPEEIIVQNYIGGTDKLRQVEKLQNNQPHVVIGTPGRLLDLLNANALKTHTAPYMVVDEADMTLDMGFLDEVDQIASRLPENGQMLVFSATIPKKLQPFLKKYMNGPKLIEIENENVISENIENWLISTRSQDRLDVIHELITMGEPYLALIFANTRENVDEIAERLTERGLEVAVIHGGLTPRDRRKVMRQVQNLEYQYVVATDLAARGIDIEGVSHVINAEIPQDLDFYIHRVGRTGRNNLEGIAITLYSPGEEEEIDIIEKKGIEFLPKEIKNGRVVDTYDRRRRQQRKGKNTKDSYDPEIAGMRKKAKKNIKPGYKKKINYRKKQKQRQENKRKYRNQGKK